MRCGIPKEYKEVAVHTSWNEGINDQDFSSCTGVSKRAMRRLREKYYGSKETGEVVRIPLDAGRPRLPEPGSVFYF